MEELKLLVESIAGLPDLAIWVVAMYFFFKLAIVGSIFGVTRLFINKLYDIFKIKYAPKEIIEKVVTRDVVNVYDINFGRFIMEEASEDTYREVDRLLKGLIRKDKGRQYIHKDDIDRLRDFVDSYLDSLGNTNN